MSLLGTIVAIAFWHIAVPQSERTNRNIKRAAIVTFCITFLLGTAAWTLDRFFQDELRTASIENALHKNVPLPKWWDNVEAEGCFDTIVDARTLHQSLTKLSNNTSKTKESNRAFFKLAYRTLQNVNLDADTVLELVYLMDRPHVDYTHMFELQKYALTKRNSNMHTRAQLLIHMLTNYSKDKKPHGYAISLSYDLITESASKLSTHELGLLCHTLAEGYNGRAANHFEIHVFEKCVVNMSKKSSTPKYNDQLNYIKSKLELMKQNAPKTAKSIHYSKHKAPN